MKEEYEQTVLAEALTVDEPEVKPEEKSKENINTEETAAENNGDPTENNAESAKETPKELDVAKAEKSSADEPARVGRAVNKGRARSADDKNAGDGQTEGQPEKLTKEKAMQVLEAIMFANGDEVYFDQFAKIAGCSVKEAKQIVLDYAKLYDTESFPRGVRMVVYDNCAQLSTLPELGEYVTQMIGIRGEPQLSPAALETLAIIAYNQPVTRPYIDEARRVDSSRSVALLLDRELIEEKGRLNVIGHPKLYGTTQNFLKTFGITSLDELPSLDLFPSE